MTNFVYKFLRGFLTRC